MAISTPTLAQEEAAKVTGAGVLERMSETMAEAESFTVTIVSQGWLTIDGVGYEQGGRAELAVARPGRLRLEMTQGLKRPVVVSDGTEVTVLSGGRTEYMVEPAPGTVGDLTSGADETQEIMLADAFLGMDLLLAPRKGILWEGFGEPEYLGEAMIEGERCQHVRLQQPEVTLEFFVAAGDVAVLRRMEIQMQQQVQGNPWEKIIVKGSHRWDLTDWALEPNLPAETFAFEAPAGTKQVGSLDRPRMLAHDHPLVGKEGPAFRMPLLDGGEATLSEHRDKDVVVLDFWATWCPPCRESLPALAQVAQEYKDKSVAFYAVNQAEDATTVKRFLSQQEWKLPVALDQDQSVAQKYGMEGIPHLVVIGKDGRIAAVHTGYAEGTAEALAGELERQLTPGGQAVLVVRDVRVQPNPTTVGAGATLTVEVENTGEADAPAGQWQIIVYAGNQIVLGFAPSPVTIKARTKAKVTYPPDVWQMMAQEAGTYPVQVIIDPEGVVSGGDARARKGECEWTVTSPVGQRAQPADKEGV